MHHFMLMEYIDMSLYKLPPYGIDYHTSLHRHGHVNFISDTRKMTATTNPQSEIHILKSYSRDYQRSSEVPSTYKSEMDTPRCSNT